MKKYKETIDLFFLAVEHSHGMSATHLAMSMYFIGKAQSNIDEFRRTQSKSSNFKLNLYSQLATALNKLESNVYELLKHYSPDESYLSYLGFDEQE